MNKLICISGVTVSTRANVELITYPIHMQMSSKSIVLHMQNIADSTDINFKHFSFKK